MLNINEIEYISSIKIDSLLIFYTLGLTLLIFGSQLKINKTESKLSQQIKIAPIYNFSNFLYNCAFVYLVCGVIILVSSIFPDSSKIVKPLLYNFSFILALTLTMFITLSFIFIILIHLIKKWVISKIYNINL